MAVEDDDAGADMGEMLADATSFERGNGHGPTKTGAFYIVEYDITKKMHEFLSDLSEPALPYFRPDPISPSTTEVCTAWQDHCF
jgi:hypothetical protein